MTLQFSMIATPPESQASPCVVVGIYEGGLLTSASARVDSALDSKLKRLSESGDLSGRIGSSLLLCQPEPLQAERLLVVGLGPQQSFDAHRYQQACREAARALAKLPLTSATVYLPEIEVAGRDAAWRVRTAALAIDHGAYRYRATFKPRQTPQPPRLEQLELSAGNGDTKQALIQAAAIGQGVRFARELANLPPNICNPAYLAAEARRFAEAHANVEYKGLDREAMEALGFGSLLAVARGSANPPELVVLEYRGGAAEVAPYALVGKGITFDTGGISLKPGSGMDEMKFDMGGAAGVLGAFVAAVELALPINLVCVVPAVENMPDGNAYRPGDVLTSLAGLTIEVLNTDAEGRLVLCDALTWTGQTYQPQAMIDAATLTGACVVALGKHASGLMSKHDDLAAELLAASETSLDRVWRLPLWDDYQNQLESVFADVANIGGKSAGAITAGCFLARFAEDRRWAHLDIAGTAWDEGRRGMATGRPVPILAQWLIDRAAETKH